MPNALPLSKLEKSGFLSRQLFWAAYEAKLSELKQGIFRRDSIWDALVFRRMQAPPQPSAWLERRGPSQAQLGGCVELMVTGSAPIAPQVLEMCRVLLSCVILEGTTALHQRVGSGESGMGAGYGQTECSAVATVTLPGDCEGGHVGGPAPACHVTLLDVPRIFTTFTLQHSPSYTATIK